MGLGEVALGAREHRSQGQVGSLGCGRAEPAPFTCGWIYCQLLGAADVGYSVLATQCWLLSVSPLYHPLCFRSRCSAGPSGAALHQAGDRLCSHGHADLGCAYRIYAIKALEHQPICFNAHFYSLSNINFESRPSAKAIWKHLSIVLESHG